jgi:hypothetical protein
MMLACQLSSIDNPVWPNCGLGIDSPADTQRETQLHSGVNPAKRDGSSACPPELGIDAGTRRTHRRPVPLPVAD